MELIIKINLDGAAFEACQRDDASAECELCTILDQVHNHFEIPRPFTGFTLRDSNGNTVGSVEVTE